MTPRRSSIILVCVLAVLLALTVAGAQAAATLNEVIFNCPANQSQAANVDPLKSFGVSPTAHNHTPAGAQAFSATSTVPQMLSGSTSCQLASDHSMFWFPTPMTPLGQHPATINATYYLANVQHTGTNTTISDTAIQGLRFITPQNGADCTSKFTCDAATYLCNMRGATPSKTIPARCVDAAGVKHGYTGVIYSLFQCWDGKSLGQGMGGAGAANIIGTDIIGFESAACPAGYTRIPGVAIAFSTSADAVGGYLSSDVALKQTTTCPGCSLHFDFVLGESTNSLGQQTLPLIITKCLNLTAVPVTTSPWQACAFHAADRTLYQWDQATGHWDKPVTN